MRELVYYVAVSLDGRIAAPDGDFSAFPTSGDHMDWIFREYADTLPAPALTALGLTADNSRFTTVLMGWETYDVGRRVGLIDPYPHLEQVVFTRRHANERIPANVRLVSSDPVAEVERLRRRDGESIWLCGGGTLASALAEQIDRLVLKVNPVVLGAGISLFEGDCRPRPARLVASTTFGSGVVANEYDLRHSA
ncbi:riboflavin biosynthesis protein RibD [Frankia sp. R43]|uniref:dihydrofolate reductase family protein n=1 Tax=Frankia sp. R43 TaxID=269536 RepID=UPI0006CA4106|nr:dihydrofolate reductase family protein [Frankia sp. R43]KPM53662.1 riboflavin biosynthesis protein RibD [Frankia sp. R43]